MIVTPLKIAVLGAGPAGLGVAFQLAKSGHKVTLFERQESVGGLARSMVLQSHSVDLGSHRLHGRCDPEILADIRKLLWTYEHCELRLRPRRGRIYLMGRELPFPITLSSLIMKLGPRFLGRLALDQFLKGGAPSEINFETEVLKQFGPTLAKQFYFPYAKKVWGVEPKQLSSKLVKTRLSGGSPAGFWKKALRVLKRKGRHYYYPEKGFGSISRAYAKAFHAHSGQLRRGVEVQQIEERGDKVVIHWSQENEAFDYLLASIPPEPLLSLFNKDRAANTLSYRALTLLYIHLPQEQWSSFDAHYFPESVTPVSRISEAQNYHGDHRRAQGTVLCFEIPSPLLEASEATSAEALFAELRPTLLGYRLCFEGARVLKVIHLPRAYPIYDKTYMSSLERIETELQEKPRVIPFGRQGFFAHDNTHHALFIAYRLAECFASGGFDERRWAGLREQFKNHYVED